MNIILFRSVIFKKKTPVDYIIYSAIIIVGILLDQMTKWLAVKFLSPIDTFPIIKKVLHLTYVENTGAAFGILKDHRWIFIVISSVTIIALLYVLYSGRFYKNALYTVSFLLIISKSGSQLHEAYLYAKIQLHRIQKYPPLLPILDHLSGALLFSIAWTPLFKV